MKLTNTKRHSMERKRKTAARRRYLEGFRRELAEMPLTKPAYDPEYKPYECYMAEVKDVVWKQTGRVRKVSKKEERLIDMAYHRGVYPLHIFSNLIWIREQTM